MSLRPSRSYIHLHQQALTARVYVCPTSGLSASHCLGHWLATAELPDGPYVCIGYFRRGCVCALGGGVLPVMSIWSYGCRRRVLSISRDCGDSTRNGDSIELYVLTEATMQVSSGPVAVPSIS